jgi:hypothetical protein
LTPCSRTITSFGQTGKRGFDVLELSQPFRDYKGNEQLFYQVHFASGGHKVAAQVLSKYVEKLISEQIQSTEPKAELSK